MSANEEEIPSPCNDQCVMDENDICTGCFRSFIEVVKWPKVDNKTRLQYLQNVIERRKEHAGKKG
jgi:uncharacterized protein